MDTNQKLCCLVIEKHHNLGIFGQAGTGKTYIIRTIVEKLKNKSNVALTCYTGIDCLNYKGLNPMTLHRFAGLEDGRHSKERLVHLLKTDEHFQSTVSRIKNTDLLIIDEVSMVSKRIFETVEYVCRHIKEPSKLFGGIQVVLCGDFFQLPPIKDELYGDNGDYCFNANFFPKYFQHIVVLKDIHRQKEPILIKAVNELAHGEPSQETNDYINSLARPLSKTDDESNITRLHARNFDADISNYNYLQSIQGSLHTFEAEDSGDVYYLKKFVVPKTLGVKVGAKVMLLRNVDEFHVNGLVGTIIAVSNDRIEVNFDGVVVRVERYTFSKFDPVTGVAIATRYQFPLKVAHAITIHKSQGMTLPLVEVNCKFATNPGQLGVAVGRAVSTDGLRVINYSPNTLRRHPPCVYKFYDNIESVSIALDSNECCKHEYIETEEEIDDIVSESDSEDDLAEGLRNWDDTINVEHSYSSLSKTDDMLTDFETALNDFKGHPTEEKARTAHDKIILEYNPNQWYNLQRTELKKIYDECFTSNPGEYQQKQFAEFYTCFQQYVSSDKYMKSIKIFSNVPYSTNILTSVMFVIQRNLLKIHSDQAPMRNVHRTVLPTEVTSEAGRGKIRYVGGYCVAKCRYRLCSNLQKCLYKPGMEPEIDNLNEQICLIDTVIVSATEIMAVSKYKETLRETDRKQNIREGLTNITDDAFEFFEDLQKSVVKCMNHETLCTEKKYFFRSVVNTIMSSTEQLESFIRKWKISLKSGTECDSIEECVTDICEGLSTRCSHVIMVFEMIVKLFLKVIVAQFRKDYLRVIKREKGVALRKKVVEKAEKKSTECVPIKLIKTDKSSSKQTSHFKLKAMVQSGKQFHSTYKKAELQLLLKAYGTEMPNRSTKKDLGEKLYSVLINDTCTRMIHPDVFDESSRQLHRATGDDSEQTPGSGLTVPVTTHSTRTVPVTSQSTETVPVTSQSTETVPVTFPSTEPVPGTSHSTDSIQGTSHSTETVPITCHSTEPVTGTSHSTEPNLNEGSLPVEMAVAGCSHETDSGHKGKRVAKKRKVVPKKRAPQLTKGKMSKAKKRKQSKSKILETEGDDSEQCPLCGKFCRDGEDSICCDSCLKWFHRWCVHLQDDDDWDYFSSSDAVYTCPLCQ